MIFLPSHYQAVASDFTQKVAGTFATRVVVSIVGLVTSVMIARTLGPEGQGLYGLAVAVRAIGVQLGHLGLHDSNTYYAAKDRSRLAPMVGNTLLVSFGVGGLLVLLAWGAFALWPRLAPIQGTLLLLALLWIPFGLGFMLMQSLLLGLQEVKAHNMNELLSKVLTLCFIAAVAVLWDPSVEMVLLMAVMALTVAFVATLRGIRRHLSGSPVPSFALFKEHFGYGMKGGLAALFSFLILRLDLLMISYMLGPKEAGYYAVVLGMVQILWLLPSSVGAISFPTLCAMKEWPQRFRFARTTALVTGAIMLVALAAVAFVADWAISLLYGPDFAPAVVPFVWLLPGIFIWAVESVARKLLTADGFRMEVIYGLIAACVANVLLNLHFIPSMGAKGAALATTLSFAVLATVTLPTIWRENQRRHA